MTEATAMDTIRSELLDFWFGDLKDDAEVGESQSALWWGQSSETDDELSGRFGQAASAAAAGTLDHWTGSPRGRLALILLLDQLPRVIHRGTPGAFSQDEKARQTAVKGLESGADRLLRPIERTFFYLPFEHSEDPADQQRSVELFRAMAAEVPDAWKKSFDFYLDFAIRHKKIVDRFGRFPHRNAVLGRESTAEEVAFLKEPGSGF